MFLTRGKKNFKKEEGSKLNPTNLVSIDSIETERFLNSSITSLIY